ncbi:hypothetical protein DPMN_117127 [Dreissena polymorpha]|uniref:Uncharacterized protein n=1 Tax=Dreissena polymorpha TaxID=45954 RepID=A0A9D4KPA1_DREPO|nr:hypothetical protein DPMN_117127 [Dreissena polymorpha]
MADATRLSLNDKDTVLTTANRAGSLSTPAHPTALPLSSDNHLQQPDKTATLPKPPARNPTINQLVHGSRPQERKDSSSPGTFEACIAPHTGGHVFQRTETTFELNQHIIKTNILTNVYKASRVLTRKTAPPTGSHFHLDRARNVAPRVFTRKTAPPTGDHDFQRTGTTFKLNQHIIKTNILTNVYKHDPVSNSIEASRVFTRKTAPPTGSHVF